MKADIMSCIQENKDNIHKKLEFLFLKYPDLKNNRYPDELFVLLDDYLTILQIVYMFYSCSYF